MIEMNTRALRKLAYSLREDSEELSIDSDDILSIVKHLVEKEQTIANLKHEITRFHGAVEQHIKNDTTTSKSVFNSAVKYVKEELINKF